MGLILINEFLLQLKGSLQAESFTGKGTTVKVTLPLSSSNHFPPVETPGVLEEATTPLPVAR